MNKNKYTEKEYWEEYWQNYNPKKAENIYFEKLLKDFPNSGSLIEIGGFPGQYAAFFKNYKKYDVTILDYIIYPDVLRKVEKVNGLPENSIKYIESDFLNFRSTKLYDVVCSFGFIEHFENTEEMLKKHFDLLKDGGILFINLPNFRGINGIIQRIFDTENYKIHNIKMMNLEYLTKLCKKFNFKIFEVFYFGRPTIWLEPKVALNKNYRKLLEYSAKLIRRIPTRNNHILSPQIFLTGIK